MRPGMARHTEDLVKVFLIWKKGFTTEKYLSTVREIVKYTLAVIVV